VERSGTLTGSGPPAVVWLAPVSGGTAASGLKLVLPLAHLCRTSHVENPENGKTDTLPYLAYERGCGVVYTGLNNETRRSGK